MKKQLVITKYKEQILSSLFIDKELVQINCGELTENHSLGNMYLGKVKNIVKNINAAFIEISNKQMCFLPLDDCREPIFSNGKKTTKIQIGDELLVQIVKEQVKTKVPTVTCNLSITGKFVVLTYGKRGVGISNKISDKKERERLETIVKTCLSEKYGYIIRTNAANTEEKLILEEIKRLEETFLSITAKGIHQSCFSMIYEAPYGFLCDIRDGYSDEIDEIITDEKIIYNKTYEYLKYNQKMDLEKLKFYEDDMISLNRLYSIEQKLEKALQKTVWLKSGGYLVIEPTEALTVIDVNTGKAVKGKKKAQETFLKINLEAAREISKQLRLRNISGIILVDFIDLDRKENKKKLITELKEYLEKDPIKTNYIDMTALHLVEITRKKIRKPLFEQLQQNLT